MNLKKLKVLYNCLFTLIPIIFIILLYLLNIRIFNKYPTFIGCLCGTGIYFFNLFKINTFKKLRNNILDDAEDKFSIDDFVNIILMITITFLVVILVYRLMSIFRNVDDLGIMFWTVSVIIYFMAYLKLPKRFFN